MCRKASKGDLKESARAEYSRCTTYRKENSNVRKRTNDGYRLDKHVMPRSDRHSRKEAQYHTLETPDKASIRVPGDELGFKTEYVFS